VWIVNSPHLIGSVDKAFSDAGRDGEVVWSLLTSNRSHFVIFIT
jgi:hypothetical protein